MTLDTAAARYYRRLAPFARVDAEHALALEALADALARPAQIIDDVARDTDTHQAWTQVADPDAAPELALPWLAQWGGTRLLPSDTVEQQRSRIRQAAGFYRGTDQAIREEVARVLANPDGLVRVLWRPSGDRWAMTVVVRQADAPETDWKVLLNEFPNPQLGTDASHWAANNSSGILNPVSGRVSMPDASAEWGWRTKGEQPNDTSTRGVGFIMPLGSMIPAAPGEVWSAGVEVYTADPGASRDARVDILWYDAAQLAIGSGDAGAEFSEIVGGRTRPIVEGKIAPANTAFVRVQGQLLTNTPLDVLDATWAKLIVANTPTVPDYFDGDSPGYEWTGTPNASTSQRVLTHIVRDAARRQKPVGIVLTVLISDEPIIDEADPALTIDAIGSAGTTIDAITLADWT